MNFPRKKKKFVARVGGRAAAAQPHVTGPYMGGPEMKVGNFN